MADYIRRLVSGDKARFKDGRLDLELDLVYLTDQIIIMGYPAAGIEGLYRNQREHARKFLDHRHGKNYWIYNFCPIKENSYDPAFFYGRVSRYPYPDHHTPPLAVMPLLAREMREWLRGSPDRVAVLHCKAGKGRSGTMACAYLLSLDDSPAPPKLERSYSAKQWANMRAVDTMQVVPEDADDSLTKSSLVPDTLDESIPALDSETSSSQAEPSAVVSSASTPMSTRSSRDSLKDVLDLHTARRMKAPSTLGEKKKQGVSIPSQRRYLYYWALLLARHETPANFWAIPSALSPARTSKVRLTEVVLRMRETSAMKMNLVRAANFAMNRINKAKNARVGGTGRERVWVSLARYDDDLVKLLEKWEKLTRDKNHMGWRKPGSEQMGDEEVDRLFEDGRWDKNKMIRSFARLGAVGDAAVVQSEDNKDGKTFTYIMHPLTDKKWDEFRDDLGQAANRESLAPGETNLPLSEANSMYDVTQSAKERGVVLDPGREVRVKLYMGQVFMGWLWFIPTFHMPAQQAGLEQPEKVKFVLTRKEIDFALGIGSAIIDVEISLEWLKETDAERVQPPARLDNEGQKAQGMDDEPTGIAATVQAVTGDPLQGVVEAKQASGD